MADETPKIADHAKSDRPSERQVADFHTHSDKDGSPKAIHHSLGSGPNQASPGNHTHDGGASALLDTTLFMAGRTVTGSKGGNAALASLITQLSQAFGFTDSTT